MMKNFTLLLFTFFIANSFYTQNNYRWDMPGAVWTHLTLAYSPIDCAIPGQINKRTLTKVSDSIIGSQFGSFFYHKFLFTETPMTDGYVTYHYLNTNWMGYAHLAFQNDILYFRHDFVSVNDSTIAEDTLVNFNASIGDTWMFHDALTDDDFELFGQGKSGRTTVLDTGSRMINAEYLKWINVSYQPIGLSGLDTLSAYTDTIFEKIGAKLNLFPSERFYFLEEHFDTPTFACYEDNTFPEYVEKPNVCSFNLGIEESKTETVRIYPNPSSDILHIKLKDDSKINKYVFYGIDGKIVKLFEAKTTEVSIDISNLPEGVYILHFLENGNPIQTKRIYKIR